MSKELFMEQREFESMPISKATVKNQIEAVKRDLESGNISPKVAYIQAKVVKDVAEGIMEVSKPLIKDLETSDLPENLRLVNFSERAGYDTLDYEKDPVYAELSDELEKRKGVLKAAYNHSRNMSGVMADDQGVEIPVVPVKSSVSASLIVKY